MNVIKTGSGIIIEMDLADAELLQSVVLQFAEKVANCKAHECAMRKLSMLIDKEMPR